MIALATWLSNRRRMRAPHRVVNVGLLAGILTSGAGAGFSHVGIPSNGIATTNQSDSFSIVLAADRGLKRDAGKALADEALTLR